MWFLQSLSGTLAHGCRLHSSLSLTFIEQLFLCKGMLVPQDAAVSKKDMFSTLEKFTTRCNF